MSGQPRESLVQYEPETAIHKNSDLAKISNLGNKKKPVLPPLESKPSTDDILNAILPPREWDHEGTHYIQYVSHNAASREDVANLQKTLDEKLLARQARQIQYLNSHKHLNLEQFRIQVFVQSEKNFTVNVLMKLLDKLLLIVQKEFSNYQGQQFNIHHKQQKGILLLRVRDELKMTIAAYQTLYQSSVTFGMRKQLQSEQGKADTEQKISDLEKKKAKLEERRVELLNKKEAIEKKNKEKRDIEEQKRKQEIEFLKYQSQHLEQFLKSVTQDLK